MKGLMEGAWGGTEENPLITSVCVDVKTVGTISTVPMEVEGQLPMEHWHKVSAFPPTPVE